MYIYLTAEQCQSVNTGCPFVDHIQSVVPVELLDRVVTHVASATQNLKMREEEARVNPNPNPNLNP